jgi:uncharacterized protein YlxW (UPF0749 family)
MNKQGTDSLRAGLEREVERLGREVPRLQSEIEQTRIFLAEVEAKKKNAQEEVINQTRLV